MQKNSKKFLLISPDFPPPLVGGSLVYLFNLVSNCPENFDVLTGPKREEYSEIFDLPNRVYRSSFIKDSHDPSTLNQQGPDSGPQYRSIAFYTNENELQAIRNKISMLKKGKRFAKITTEVSHRIPLYKL